MLDPAAAPSVPRAADAYFDAGRETMPRRDIERFQEARLLELLPRVGERGALIRSVWEAAGVKPGDIRSLADFRERAPFIDKDAIRRYRDRCNDPVGGLQIADPIDVVTISTTSGTTGDPTPVPHGLHSLADIDLRRSAWQIGVRPGDCITYMLFTYRGGVMTAYAMREMGATSIALAHDPAQIPRFVAASKRYRPALLVTISNPLIIAFEQYFERTGVDAREVFASYRGAVFGGEPLSPRFRKLTDSWGLELFDYTTLGDVCGAMECRMHDGVHAWEDLALVENLDEKGRPVPDGEVGELVVTAIGDRHAPLIRYRTEDLVRMDHRVCGCGRTHARFWPLGRKGDQILVQGRSILPRAVQPVIESEDECRACLFQIIRSGREMDVLRLRVGYDAAALHSTPGALAARLHDRLRAAFEVPVEVELALNEELLKLGPPHKIPRVTKQ